MTELIKCRRTACSVMIDARRAGTHVHTRERYCLACSHQINRACGEKLVLVPRDARS